MAIVGNKINKVISCRRGSAIYLAAVILSIVLTAAFGVSLIVFYQLKNINEAGNSVIAFAAAETGIEWSLTYVDENNYNGDYNDECSGKIENLDNGAFYRVNCELCGDDESLCIKSEGNYKGTRRTIRIQR